MPYLSPIVTTSQSRVVTDTFKGLNRSLRPADGEFAYTENLTTAFYPLLATRAPRGLVKQFSDFRGILAGEALAWVDGGTLYYAGLPTALTGLTAGEKQLVSFGAYICIFPDKKYYNTENAADYGSLEAFYETPGATAQIQYRACLSDGTELNVGAPSATAPNQPSNGDLWVSSTDGGYYSYSSLTGSWTLMTNVYTKILLPSFGRLSGFSALDAVTISGSTFNNLNGSHIVCALGGSSSSPDAISSTPDGSSSSIGGSTSSPDAISSTTGGTTTASGGSTSSLQQDYIVITGTVPSNYTDSAGHLSISRTVPAMDYVCQCGNRLWGCYYGLDTSGSPLNELYCCALGDFKNWSRFQGISTDSWTASVGTPGEWTGCISFLGYPTFFKENSIHKIIVSASGSHQIEETPCRGVQKGCAKSLQIVGETLYYKSLTQVCAWQGGFPIAVSEKLGDLTGNSASAGVLGDCYYLSLNEPDTGWCLLVYDTGRRLWIREDASHVTHMVTLGRDLYAVIQTTTPTAAVPTTVAATPTTPAAATSTTTAAPAAAHSDSATPAAATSTSAIPTTPTATAPSSIATPTTSAPFALTSASQEGGDTNGQLQSTQTQSQPTQIHRLWALTGSVGERENAPGWIAESGIQYYSPVNRKYVSRYEIRLRMETGSTCTAYLMYDSSGIWEESGSVSFTGTDSRLLPVRPRRCDHLRFKLCGTGSVRIFSIARTVE